MAEYSMEQLQEFWSLVRMNPKTDCWEWEGTYHADKGNGKPSPRFHRNGLDAQARRVAFQLCFGQLPKVCLMTCGNHKCVCPAHMTTDKSTLSVESRARGKRISNKKILRVVKLGNSGLSSTKIAKKTGISQGQVSWILRMKDMCLNGDLQKLEERTSEKATNQN